MDSRAGYVLYLCRGNGFFNAYDSLVYLTPYTVIHVLTLFNIRPPQDTRVTSCHIRDDGLVLWMVPLCVRRHFPPPFTAMSQRGRGLFLQTLGRRRAASAPGGGDISSDNDELFETDYGARASMPKDRARAAPTPRPRQPPPQEMRMPEPEPAPSRRRGGGSNSQKGGRGGNELRTGSSIRTSSSTAATQQQEGVASRGQHHQFTFDAVEGHTKLHRVDTQAFAARHVEVLDDDYDLAMFAEARGNGSEGVITDGEEDYTSDAPFYASENEDEQPAVPTHAPPMHTGPSGHNENFRAYERYATSVSGPNVGSQMQRLTSRTG